MFYLHSFTHNQPHPHMVIQYFTLPVREAIYGAAKHIIITY